MGHTHTIVVGDTPALANINAVLIRHHCTLMRDNLRFLCHRR